MSSDTCETNINNNKNLSETTATGHTNEREIQFLRAQHARLSKNKLISRHNTNNDDTIDKDGIAPSTEYGNLNTDDNERSSKHQRQIFWDAFKRETASIHSQLDEHLQAGPSPTESPASSLPSQYSNDLRQSDNDKENKPTLTSKKSKYVTAHQRNAALSRLQTTQNILRALETYALHGRTIHESQQTEHTESASASSLLPEYFTKHSMPELPIADVRLVNRELTSLKSKADIAQDVIMPKEKFRFHRYRAFLKEGKNLQNPVVVKRNGPFQDKFLVEGASERSQQCEETNVLSTQDSSSPYHFDGLTFEKHCRIAVERDGKIRFLEKECDLVSENTTSLNFVEEKKDGDFRSFLIRNVEHCEISLNDTYKSVHMTNINNSKLHIASAVLGPVHVTNCHNTCIFIPFCRQLRIHDCTNVSFTIHVASGPIIEGCREMKFYQEDYDDILNKDRLNVGQNLYWDVKDFNWLKHLVKSPNYEVFSKVEREKDSSTFPIGEVAKGNTCNPAPKRKVSEENIDQNIIGSESSDEDEL